MFSFINQKFSQKREPQRSFSPRLERLGRPGGPSGPPTPIDHRASYKNTASASMSSETSSNNDTRACSTAHSTTASGSLNSSHTTAPPRTTEHLSSNMVSSIVRWQQIDHANSPRDNSANASDASSAIWTHQKFSTGPQTTVRELSSQPSFDYLPCSQAKLQKPKRLFTPADRDQAAKSRTDHDPLEQCMKDNIAYDIAHGLRAQTPIPKLENQYDLVYNVWTKRLRREVRDIRKGKKHDTLSLDKNNPPFLVDGRKIYLEIPKWCREMTIYWRTCDVNRVVHTHSAKIKLTFGIWWEKNMGSSPSMEMVLER